MLIDTIDPRHDPAWERFLLRAPEATVFHTSMWARVLTETYGFQPHYLVARDDGQIAGGLPLLRVTGGRLVGLPFSDSCPPLALGAAAESSLIDALVQLARRDGVELRGAPGLEERGFVRAGAYLQHTIALDASTEELTSRLRKNTRRHVRQAEDAGLTVRVSRAPEDMERFYALNVATRKKHSLVPQPWRFFENLQRYAIDEGGGFLMLCEHEGRVIAGDLLLVFKDALYGKYNASDARHLHLRPNHLLLQRTLELGASLGYLALDLGRCEVENEGLRQFKLGWGSIETPLYYHRYPAGAAATATERARGARRLLGLFVRFAPAWALRHAGGLLYRYAA